ncbi:MAG: class I SAM-dependent methyltransferase [Algicola sp.]|nr:class I SAM-dependent methyltransferase [Algicola sp.]
MDIVEFNRDAWNKESKAGGEWSQPVNPEQITQARQGDWTVVLTPLKSVPKDWFGPLTGKQVLGLASGGGQQMPIMAAAGAHITSFDNSDEQLAKDQMVAQRESLLITTHQGDMADLSVFDDAQFDLIFHPIANCFVPDVDKVWRECFRVLKPGGRLLAGFCNPAMYLFDHDKAEQSGELKVEFTLPCTNLPDAGKDLNKTKGLGDAIEFSHSLDNQIGGQIAAGFTINGFYEDKWSDEALVLNKYMPTSMATLAIKPGIAQ